MTKLLSFMASLRALFQQVAQTGFAFVALVILVYLLLGEDSGTFVLSVIANLSVMIRLVTPEAIIGVALVLALMALLRRRG